ncbi:hypothetical protein BYT27DRAFT_7182580, partial [Phlegmacium glaucopus]
MPPKKNTQKRKETVVELPHGALQTTFALDNPPDPAPTRQLIPQKAAPAPEINKNNPPNTIATGLNPSGQAILNPQHQSSALESRIRKPSKRQQGIDPLLPITPARPKASTRTIPVPVPPTSFASRQIQVSQNQVAATVLFTPHARQHRHTGPVPAYHPPTTPTPLGAPKPVTSLSSNSSPSDSEVEDEVRIGLERLDLKSQSGSQSGSQSPRAGPHSKQRKVTSRPRGGAKDVWIFFEKSSDRHTCLLCKQAHATDPSHHVSDFSV